MGVIVYDEILSDLYKITKDIFITNMVITNIVITNMYFTNENTYRKTEIRATHCYKRTIKIDGWMIFLLTDQSAVSTVDPKPRQVKPTS